MSTKENRMEKILNQPKPGEVGGPMVGYAEAQRHQNPEVETIEVSETADAHKQIEALSGKTLGEMTEEEFYRIPVKLSPRNTSGMTELHVVFKDPNMTGHWFNAKAKDGMRVQQAYMQGFTACTKEDVEMCHATSTDDNGSLVQGDLVLLKIPKLVLWSRYKDQQESAKSRVNRAMNDPKAASRAGDRAGSLPNGADYFIPDIAKASRVDADEARRLVYS